MLLLLDRRDATPPQDNHITGWAKDEDGVPFTGEPHPSGKDFRDEGIPGLMAKYDEVDKRLKFFIIERKDEKFHTSRLSEHLTSAERATWAPTTEEH
jgi:hypothetical protein